MTPAGAPEVLRRVAALDTTRERNDSRSRTRLHPRSHCQLVVTWRSSMVMGVLVVRTMASWVPVSPVEDRQVTV